MFSKNVKVGDRLEIVQKNGSGEPYLSQVAEIMSKNEILIYVPISGGQLIKLSTRENYSIIFFNEKGMLRFDAKIIRYIKEGQLNYVHVIITSDGEKMQRREFFRYNCLLPFKFYDFGDNIDYSKFGEPALIEGVIKDIGGGGLRFVSNYKMNDGSNIKCNLTLNDACIVIIGKVLSSQFFPKSDYKYQYRVEFLAISDKEQEVIIQFIFNEQRKGLNKLRR